MPNAPSCTPHEPLRAVARLPAAGAFALAATGTAREAGGVYRDTGVSVVDGAAWATRAGTRAD